MKHKLNKSPEQVIGSIKEHVIMQENLLMMLSGLVKMEQEQIWILCVKLLNLQLSLVQKQLIFLILLVIQFLQNLKKLLKH